MSRPDQDRSAAKRYGWSWGWPKALGGSSASWGVWLRRGDFGPQVAWRLNIGPLHIVRMR